jgi:hypothetical protein
MYVATNYPLNEEMLFLVDFKMAMKQEEGSINKKKVQSHLSVCTF